MAVGERIRILLPFLPATQPLMTDLPTRPLRRLLQHRTQPSITLSAPLLRRLGRVCTARCSYGRARLRLVEERTPGGLDGRRSGEVLRDGDGVQRALVAEEGLTGTSVLVLVTALVVGGVILLREGTWSVRRVGGGGFARRARDWEAAFAADRDLLGFATHRLLLRGRFARYGHHDLRSLALRAVR